jgi:DNA-binding PadR family transcriptional regulator
LAVSWLCGRVLFTSGSLSNSRTSVGTTLFWPPHLPSTSIHGVSRTRNFSQEKILTKVPGRKLSAAKTRHPIVDLTPGSISTAVERLIAKGLVSRGESAEDRRVRIVALTPHGKDLIVSAFRKHSEQMKRVFSELSLEELRGLEVRLKKVGKRAAALMEES